MKRGSTYLILDARTVAFTLVAIGLASVCVFSSHILVSAISAVALVALCAGALIGRARLQRTSERVREAACAFGNGDREARLEPGLGDRALARVFNEMAESIDREYRALFRSTQLARESFESSLDGVYWLDETGQIVGVNQAACCATGLARDELLTMTVFDLDPVVTPESWCEYWRRLTRGEHLTIETTHRNAEGREYPVLVTCSIVEQDGQRYSCAIARDITVQKRVNGAIRTIASASDATRENFFGELCRSLCMALDVRVAGISERIDDGRARVLAMWDGESFSQGVEYDLSTTPCDVAFTSELCVYDREVSRRFPRDEMFIDLGAESYAGIRLRDTSGQTLGILFVIDSEPMEDVKTVESLIRLFAARASAELERHHTERHLREARDSARRLAAVAENTDNMVMILDRDWNIEWVNRAFERTTGYASSEVAGQRPFDVLTGPETDPEALESLRRGLKAGEPAQVTMAEYGKDGEPFWAEIRVNPMRDENGEIIGYISVERDVTEERAQRERLARAQNRADAANRAKSEFLANMSHEIRTPMTAILGYAEMLDNDGVLDASLKREAAGTIRRNGEHLLALVNDILDISRIEAGKMNIQATEHSMTELVEGVLGLMRVRAAGKGIELRAEYAERLPETVQTDPTRVRQVLTNLIGNAIKFTEVGEVVVRVRHDVSGEAPALLRLEVEDTGIGMTEAQLREAMAFRAFSQTDTSMSRRFGGTGLGLSISSSLVRHLGGELTIRSKPGVGTVVSFTIDPGDLRGVRMVETDVPVQGEEAMTPETHAARSEVSDDALSGLRILFAEDGPDNQRLITYHLARAGASVDIAVKGCEALSKIEAAEESGEPYDVVLMDMQMPEMDGYEATRELRGRGYDAPIVALTAHAMSGERERCLEAGCDAYLSKPVDWCMLIDSCLEFAQGQRSEAA